jgi:hypothetical protein
MDETQTLAVFALRELLRTDRNERARSCHETTGPHSHESGRTDEAPSIDMPANLHRRYNRACTAAEKIMVAVVFGLHRTADSGAREVMSGDETEPYRHFQEHLEAVIRATPVETRPLLDLEKLRASFEFGPSQREPTVVVSPVRYAQSLLRRIEQLVGELKEIVERGEAVADDIEHVRSIAERLLAIASPRAAP